MTDLWCNFTFSSSRLHSVHSEVLSVLVLKTHSVPIWQPRKSCCKEVPSNLLGIWTFIIHLDKIPNWKKWYMKEPIAYGFSIETTCLGEILLMMTGKSESSTIMWWVFFYNNIFKLIRMYNLKSYQNTNCQQ